MAGGVFVVVMRSEFTKLPFFEAQRKHRRGERRAEDKTLLVSMKDERGMTPSWRSFCGHFARGVRGVRVGSK